ncbi:MULTISPECIES: mycofactocin system transcriptional regulator [Nocardia]|uniref:mycofactocin system transcriptional regulator n=1 Tax=Nocardia TaxID=1817 RepID=UPI0007EB7D75|nr:MULTISPECIES: mycofactocin system transcriptional regulator [Nocardia]MBF6278400.1 mycofactocin system transcriptional regulator [Nocardia nova]OBB30244.1 mycofactocin system transcriptional regulator [Nocardia sp. 852002-51244_SCH5132740]
MSGNPAAKTANRRGRRPSTSATELEKVAFALFEQHGFEATTVEDIATTAGITKRTFFRYFESKNDVVWGSFSDQLRVMRERFARCPDDQPIMDAVRTVVVDFNRFDADQVPWHRKRMELILRVPALQAHSTLRYREWRAFVAEFVAMRLGLPVGDLIPRSVSYAALGVAISGYEYWLAEPDADLTQILDCAFKSLATGFALPHETNGHRTTIAAPHDERTTRDAAEPKVH